MVRERLVAAVRLLRNPNIILLLAFIVGLVFGQALSFTTRLTLPALAIIVAAGASEIPTHALSPLRRLERSTLLAVIASYLIATPAILLVAWLLIADPELLTGFIFVAISPPGVIVLPFTATLGGDVTLSLVGTVGAYLSALIVTPLLAALLIGPMLVQPLQLFITLVEVILIPLLVSRLLRWPPLLRHLDHWRTDIVAWGFFVVIVSVVAINRDVFLSEPIVLALSAAVALITVFGVGFLVESLLGRAGIEHRTLISLTMFAVIKNGGFAAATALALVSPRASLPGAVTTAVIALYLISLSLRAGQRRRR